MRKRAIILVPHGHRLANQLWAFISIYAYCLEKGYICENPSFFRYHRFFCIPKQNIISRLLAFFNNAPWQRMRGLSYVFYENYAKRIKKRKPQQVISIMQKQDIFYLPPSQTDVPEYQEALSRIEKNAMSAFYFDGWLFRNPVGIEKYRKQIERYFAPKIHITEKIDAFLAPLRRQYSHIVGVHIRQGDYRTYADGVYFFTQKEVKNILLDYLHFFKKESKKVLFVICSDEEIDASAFTGLHIVTPKGTIAEDLFTLAKTDIIIGSNSTYGAFAACYGNIPIAVFKRPSVDWTDIDAQKGFNHNNNCTLVHP